VSGHQAGPRASDPGAWGGRFPGFDTVAQASHWDQVTADVVLSRLRIPQELSFFTPAEEAAATALCDHLLGQDGDGDGRIPVVVVIDARLARMETDGWRYEDMPEDTQAWRDTLRYLDDDAQAQSGGAFAQCKSADQQALSLQAVPRRPVQRLRPGRALPHGAGSAADGRPVRRGSTHVQGAAARGQQ
jgi:hypothetical protein